MIFLTAIAIIISDTDANDDFLAFSDGFLSLDDLRSTCLILLSFFASVTLAPRHLVVQLAIYSFGAFSIEFLRSRRWGC
jgi:hypothetical protein